MEFKKLPNGTANFQPHPAIHELLAGTAARSTTVQVEGSGRNVHRDRPDELSHDCQLLGRSR